MSKEPLQFRGCILKYRFAPVLSERENGVLSCSLKIMVRVDKSSGNYTLHLLVSTASLKHNYMYMRTGDFRNVCRITFFIGNRGDNMGKTELNPNVSRKYDKIFIWYIKETMWMCIHTRLGREHLLPTDFFP